MLFSIEQAFVRSDEIRAPLKTSAWEANLALPCEQWFLQAGRYASMAKKPLRATVCFSIEHARPLDDYEYPMTRR